MSGPAHGPAAALGRVLVFGGSGQVGQAVRRCAPAGVAVLAPASGEVDLRRADAVAAAVRDAGADAVVNCAAFTRVDDAEAAVDDAYAVNADGPAAMAAAAAAAGARFVHVSTDYVFGGAGDPPFGPDAPANPLGVYGASKREGERRVLAADPRAAVVRTAWVHSGGGVNFVRTAARLLAGGAVMRVVDDQVSTPTRALHLAEALWALAARRDLAGVLHCTDAGVASWYDVAECVLATLAAEDAAPPSAAVVPVDSSAHPRPARRPRVSLLDKHATWRALGLTPVHWRAGVAASTREVLRA